MTSKAKKYWIQFAIGMTLYGIFVVLLAFALNNRSFPRLILALLGFLPMIPAVWAMFGWLNAVRTMDELQQKIQLEAAAFSLSITALATFSYGFFETVAGFPKLSMFFVWPIIALTFILGAFLANQRYN